MTEPIKISLCSIMSSLNNAKDKNNDKNKYDIHDIYLISQQ